MSLRLGSMIAIREAVEGDAEVIWEILEPVIRAGEAYALPVAMAREDALAFWFTPGKTVFVAEEVREEGSRAGTRSIVGTYFVCANQRGGGAHVANCGYATAAWALGAAAVLAKPPYLPDLGHLAFRLTGVLRG